MQARDGCGCRVAGCGVLRRLSVAVGLLVFVAALHAQTAYECVVAHGNIAFQAAPCQPHARQRKLTLHPLPLVQSVAAIPIKPARSTTVRQWSTTRNAKSRRATSWECRAGDGELFYRHSRCPHSIAGDGVARSDAAQTQAKRGKGVRARDAWASQSVTARKIPRDEACRRINAVAAVDRDGSRLDEQVSVYEHDLGRDPCRGY